MDDDRWSMVDGRWSIVDGRWSMIDGRWTAAFFFFLFSAEDWLPKFLGNDFGEDIQNFREKITVRSE